MLSKRYLASQNIYLFILNFVVNKMDRQTEQIARDLQQHAELEEVVAE
jgi:hypothetical protein